MELQTLVVLSGFVTVVVDRIRAILPNIKGAWTNLVALGVGVATAILGDLGGLAESIVPAVAGDAELLLEIVAGIILATGGALVDQLRQIGSGSTDSGSIDGVQT